MSIEGPSQPLNASTPHLHLSLRFDPLQSDALKKFDRSTKYQSGEQGEDDDDEGMMVEDSVLVNKLCPITMRPVSPMCVLCTWPG